MPYQIDFSTTTSEQIEKVICQRLEQIRLARNLTQEQIAAESGISVRTVRNLEKGKGVSLNTFIRVLIALGIQQNFEILLPDPTVRPVERLKKGGAERKRASSQTKTEPTSWIWGDGNDNDE